MTTVDTEAERERLIGMMNLYLEALEARDPSRIPTGSFVRFTENTRQIPLGAGLWRTMSGRHPGGHWFADAERGQVEYWGAVDEMGMDTILGVRLRVEGRVVTEIETVAIRGRGSFFNPPAVIEAYPAFHEPLDPSERTPRERLVEIANLYFDAIELSDGSRVPVKDDCRRLVNGVLDSLMDPEELDTLEAHRALGVSEQMTAGHYAYIEALRARRFPIVDEARGLVICHLLFDHPGDLKRADGERPWKSPDSTLAFEVFKVRGGVLEEVWAIGTGLPYGIDSGWPA
ncbi:MAG: hypothetical protein WDM92_04240 [Caulobacteraceae bacterium]